MANRPALRKGDLVRINRRNPPRELLTYGGNGDMNGIFRVVSMTIPDLDAVRLGFGSVGTRKRRRAGKITSSEGFIEVTITDKDGRRFCVRRRELWKIPTESQPRHRRRPKKTVDDYRLRR